MSVIEPGWGEARERPTMPRRYWEWSLGFRASGLPLGQFTQLPQLPILNFLFSPGKVGVEGLATALSLPPAVEVRSNPRLDVKPFANGKVLLTV